MDTGGETTWSWRMCNTRLMNATPPATAAWADLPPVPPVMSAESGAAAMTSAAAATAELSLNGCIGPPRRAQQEVKAERACGVTGREQSAGEHQLPAAKVEAPEPVGEARRDRPPGERQRPVAQRAEDLDRHPIGRETDGRAVAEQPRQQQGQRRGRRDGI